MLAARASTPAIRIPSMGVGTIHAPYETAARGSNPSHLDLRATGPYRCTQMGRLPPRRRCRPLRLPGGLPVFLLVALVLPGLADLARADQNDLNLLNLCSQMSPGPGVLNGQVP